MQKQKLKFKNPKNGIFNFLKLNLKRTENQKVPVLTPNDQISYLKTFLFKRIIFKNQLY